MILKDFIGQDLIVGWATYIIVGADKGLAIRARNPVAVQHLRGWGDAVFGSKGREQIGISSHYKCTGYCLNFELLGLWPSELPDRFEGDTAAILSVDVVRPILAYDTRKWKPT